MSIKNKKNKNEYDVIIVGAGHAGLETAFCCAKLKLKTLLVTLNPNSIGLTPCNPSIGGPAKGVVTREIDALGGMQAIAADKNQLQMKLLNSSKGPGVWALRAQIDKVTYSAWFTKQIKKQKNLELKIAEVQEILVEDQKVIGALINNEKYFAKVVIVTSGTYLNSITHCGMVQKKEGPNGLEFASNLSDNLRNLGFDLIRLKTGTPARILRDSIDYTNLQLEPGTNKKLSFTNFGKYFLDFNKQLPCYIVHTTEETHNIIRENLDKSAMYSGNIKSIGPRYCPSIEDKIVKFSDKERHQIFIEPESRYLDTIYLGGFSTSMPKEIQEIMVRSLPGLKDCVIKKYAYAIEYDAIDPTQLNLSLMSKKINGLFFAGQINGTSGYEEAAAQGLIAGINSFNYINHKEPLILSRQEAYIGVMIDDIVTKGISEPYRLLTSRAEHRLFLRNDNATDRLMKYGYEIGLVTKKNWKLFHKKQQMFESIIRYLKSKTVGQIPHLKQNNLKTNQTLYDYVKRPEVELSELIKSIPELKKLVCNWLWIDDLSIRIKFEGYIKNQEENIKKLQKIERIDLSNIQDYKIIPNISIEAREKLNKIKPLNLDQASRISGITLNDIAKIKYYIESNKNE